MRNSFRAVCANCGQLIAPNAGILKRRHGTRNGFDTVHEKCPEPPVNLSPLTAAPDINGLTEPGDFWY